MFQTFTGNSRRPRNVNLSGQNRNPFAAKPAGGHDAVAHAQQERRARHLEREKQQAVKTVQRYWRGHHDRRRTQELCRARWDHDRDRMDVYESDHEVNGSENAAKHPLIGGGAAGTDGRNGVDGDDQAELQRAKLLSWFADPRNDGDVERVLVFKSWLKRRLSRSDHLSKDWRTPLPKLARYGLARLDRERQGADNVENLLDLVALVTQKYPAVMAKMGANFYGPLGRLAAQLQLERSNVQELLTPTILAPMLQHSYQEDAYTGFVLNIMTIPALQQHIYMDELAPAATGQQLSRTLRRLFAAKPSPISRVGSDATGSSNTRLLWMMAYFIRLHRCASPNETSYASDIDFVYVISSFLSRLGNDIGQNSDFHDTTEVSVLPRYVEEKIMSLVNQESISKLFAQSEFASTSGKVTQDSDDAAVLASYALTLLQVFPRKADEIRLWLYMSSTSALDDSAAPEPAIKYFWKAVASSQVYKKIRESPRNAVELLKAGRSLKPDADVRDGADQEWRVILLFLELYSFVLRIMDDDEFMAGGQPSAKFQSRTRQSALELSQVQDLTVFLKNFAFAMYWSAEEITKAEEQPKGDNLAAYFGRSDTTPSLNVHPEHDEIEIPAFAGVEGMSMTYMKGMATGLLRALYERDSRRSFCDPDHWLMQDIELDGFIVAVVMEQAFRDNEDRDEDAEMGDAEWSDGEEASLVGTGRTQQIRRLERLREQQSRVTRQKLLRNMTPRLEILQNMPFFIPFATRVEIFHNFVMSDQTARRNGAIDPDQWRMSLESGLGRARRGGRHELSRHTAQVRRDHVFDDAYDQFYELGEGLKEPIQITFVDQFGTTEAGIDGGGVTKEFLTSVANEAFSPDGGLGLFVENDQHLLYPNPSALDEKKSLLREVGMAEGSPEWNAEIRDLLRRYEFLGRVVGKCLYEGILVDVHFAPFFLVKWALTGGDGAGAKESNYRATLNDLRDLDEALYQGLLQLKNYEGNVEDFSLDFTTTDVVRRAAPDSTEPPQVATRELVPGGANRTVTNANRLIYISAVARHRLQKQPAAQTAAFLRGLSALIPPGWLSMFNRRELQTLLGGAAAEIDVADLRANTLYGGVYAIGDDGEEHPTVQLFWAVLADMADAERRKLLKYVTSTPRAPLLGFAQLNPRFSIRDSGSDQSRLPSTSTCVNLLKLPIYTDPRVLREKLEYAINAGAGFNLS